MTRLLRRIAHYAVYVVAVGLIVLSGLALTLRIWLLPDIDRYRPRIERLLADAIGQPVAIGLIHADWRGLNPRLVLRDLSLGPDPASAPLRLPRVDAVVSWSSLFLGEPRLTQLELLHPSLEIRRDARRVIHVAGIPVNTAGPPSPFPDWLLAQRLIVVRDGRVTWRDELLNAPPLELDRVKLVLHNRFGRHRLGLTARPPASAAAILDLRADLKGESVQRPEAFHGELYLAARQASAQALRTWAPWAQESVRAGHGDLRMWLDLERRQITRVLGDVDLRQVRVNLDADTPDMEFSRLGGRVGWRKDAAGHAIHIEGLRFASPTGQTAAPANARVLLTPGADGKPQRAQVEASALQLETLTALSGAVPLPKAAHDLIGQLRPRGFVSRLGVDWRKAGPTTAQASFRDVGMQPGGGLPGLSGLTGEAKLDAGGGQLNLRARNLGLDYAPVFRAPLAFDSLDADVTWRTLPQGGQRIEVAGLRAVNADLEGGGQARITLRPNQSPVLDVSVQLQRGEGTAVWRYLPRQIADDAYNWIKRAIRDGRAENATVVLRGPLDQFPFHKGGGEFRVDGRLRDVLLDYAPGWPGFRQVNGRLLFHGTAMEIIGDSAQVAGGITLSGVRCVVPDLHFSDEETMFITGRANGTAAAFLQFIAASPVHDYTDRLTEPMRAVGPAELDLNLTLPLRHVIDTKVKGVFRLQGTRLDPGEDMPVLEQLRGELHFTHRDLRARGVTGQVLGQPARLDLESLPGGRVRVALDGRMPAQELARWLPRDALHLLNGEAGYRAELDMKQRRAELRVASDLAGMALALPSPLGKRADEATPLLLVKTVADDGQDVLLLRYGGLLTARAMPGGEGVPARVGVSIGRGEAALPAGPGLSAQAVFKRFDLDEWLALLPDKSEGGAPALPLRELNLTANQLLAGNRAIHDGNIVAKPIPDGWQMRIASREVQGEAKVTGAGRGLRVDGQFRKLHVPDALPGRDGTTAGAERRLFSGVLEADSFAYKGMELGALKLELAAEPHGWRVRRLSLDNPDGQLGGTGILADHARRPSSLELRLDSARLGNLLTRLGQPGYLRRGKTLVEGRLGWTGGLEDFRLDDLSGDLKLDIRDGQFVKVDPGVARLLGIVSLQSLPRRIALDFRDVFSEGFGFDEISGPLHLDRGVAYLAKLNMNGPAAKVEMKGQIDLSRETQNLRVRIQPRVEETLAAGAILLNPVVGVGALVASKVLKDPIGKAISFEYLVSGGWDEPQVTKLKRPPAEANPDAP